MDSARIQGEGLIRATERGQTDRGVMLHWRMMILSDRPLAYPLTAQRDSYDYATDIRTIGDAATFIVTLPKRYDALHWRLAGSTICGAHNHPENADLLETATLALETALATDGMLYG
jgi:hypothetical protein